MSSSDRASLRQYTARFGYERVAEALSANVPDYVAVYGSLRSGFGLPDAPDVGNRLIHRGRCTIKGDLYDVGKYPGLTGGEGVVKGELYEIRDIGVLRALDEYERYDALKPEQSLFVRRVVRLLEPPVDAWVYFYNHDLGHAPRIESGNWAEHQKRD